MTLRRAFGKNAKNARDWCSGRRRGRILDDVDVSKNRNVDVIEDPTPSAPKTPAPDYPDGFGGGGVRRRTGATTLTDLGVAGGAPALSKEKKKERGQVPHRSGDTARATPLGRHRSGDTARATRVR